MGVTWKTFKVCSITNQYILVLTVHHFLYLYNLYKIGYKTPKKRASICRYGLFEALKMQKS